ncbi:MAG: leucine-rich repeat domain-containing protein [Bacteroidota bacterium]
MKPICVCLLLLSTVSSFAQCDVVNALLSKGDRFLQESNPNYQEAINAYTAAIIACPEQAQEGKQRIARMVNGINDLRKEAVSAKSESDRLFKELKIAQIETYAALEEVKVAEADLQVALTQANKLVEAFYFFGDRFALAYGESQQYFFIDKNGDRVDKLGSWERAEQFDQRGFTKVFKRNDPQAYLMDTFGSVYPVAYTLADIQPTTTALDLANQKLEILPKELWAQDQLEVLLLDNNELDSLPHQINLLPKLTVLNLHTNSLRHISSSIGELRQLQVLDMAGNWLVELPEQINQLNQLKALYLQDNSLAALPESINQLAVLENLNVGYNSLEHLPESLTLLKKLKTLELYDNSLTSIPDSIGMIERLQTLNLRVNSLANIPESICELKRLEILDLSGNWLTSLPERIGQLQQLEILDLSDNSINAVPASIGHLKGLHTLDLRFNFLNELPQSISQLEQLKTIGVAGNALENLPSRINELPRIKDKDRNSVNTKSQDKTKSFTSLLTLFENYAERKSWDFARQIRQSIMSYNFDPLEFTQLSKQLVLCQDYEGAIWAAEASVTKGETDINALSSMGLACLYDGQESRAMQVFREYISVINSEGKFGREIFLQDLNDTAHLEVKDPEAVARVRAFLENQ